VQTQPTFTPYVAEVGDSQRSVPGETDARRPPSSNPSSQPLALLAAQEIKPTKPRWVLRRLLEKLSSSHNVDVKGGLKVLSEDLKLLDEQVRELSTNCATWGDASGAPEVSEQLRTLQFRLSLPGTTHSWGFPTNGKG